MANCTAMAIAYDSKREKSVSRLGSEAAVGTAATQRTKALVYVRKDGSGHMSVRRDGAVLVSHTFGREETAP